MGDCGLESACEACEGWWVARVALEVLTEAGEEGFHTDGEEGCCSGRRASGWFWAWVPLSFGVVGEVDFDFQDDDQAWASQWRRDVGEDLLPW